MWMWMWVSDFRIGRAFAILCANERGQGLHQHHQHGCIARPPKEIWRGVREVSSAPPRVQPTLLGSKFPPGRAGTAR